MINQGRPYYEDFELQRSLLSFKLYHDLALDMDFASFAHGPCWEPTLSQFSIGKNCKEVNLVVFGTFRTVVLN